MPGICLYCRYRHFAGEHYECAYPRNKGVMYEFLGFMNDNRPLWKYYGGGKKIKLDDRCSKWKYGGGWCDDNS